MELSHYGRFLTRHLTLIIGTGVVVALVAGGVAAAQPEQQSATATVLLKVRDDRQLTEYDYDQFYVTQGTTLYASNVATWLNSSQTKEDLRRAAGVGDGNIRGKKSGGTIELVGTADQADQATALTQAAIDLIVSRTDQLAPGPSRSTFQAVSSTITTRSVTPAPVRDGAIGLAAGLVLGLVFALAAEAAGPKRRTRS